jgi:hypothetical protein
MAQTQIADVIVPAEFTAYQVENSLVSTALFQSGVAVPNGEMASHLLAGAEQFSVPFRADAGEQETDITRGRKLDISPYRRGPFSAQVTHVKPLNRLTHDETTTSTCPMSFPQPAILDIELKKRKPRPPAGANSFRKTILAVTPLL